MKQKIFAICDMEEAYALRMAEYMLEKIRLPYALHLFTKVEELEKFMEEEEIAILLDRKSTRLNSSHIATSRMPSSA